MTFLPFNQSLVLCDGFLESDALSRAGFAPIEEGSIHFVCKSVLRDLCSSHLGNTFGGPDCSGDAGDDKLQICERQSSSDRSQEQVLREKLAGDALRQQQRQRDLSTRFGAFKVPGREDSDVCSSGSDSDVWLWLWLVSRQMSEQPGAA